MTENNIQTDPTQSTMPTKNLNVKEQIISMKRIIKKHNSFFPATIHGHETEEHVFARICNQIKHCSQSDLELLKILLAGDLDTYRHLASFKEILTLFISLVALIASLFYSPYEGNLASLVLMITGICIFVILAFWFIHTFTGKKIKQVNYLLQVIEYKKATFSIDKNKQVELRTLTVCYKHQNRRSRNVNNKYCLLAGRHCHRRRQPFDRDQNYNR